MELPLRIMSVLRVEALAVRERMESVAVMLRALGVRVAGRLESEKSRVEFVDVMVEWIEPESKVALR